MATLTAPTVFGAMHGLETLSQLITFDFDDQVGASLWNTHTSACFDLVACLQSYKLAAAPWTINDKPRFAHREVLVDTARHFQSRALRCLGCLPSLSPSHCLFLV